MLSYDPDQLKPSFSVCVVIYTIIRPNGDLIVAKKKVKLFVKIGDVVSFSTIFNKKNNRENKLHKIVKVRYDLQWHDIHPKNSRKFYVQ